MAPNLSIYLGRRGSGKSTLAAWDAQNAADEDVMVVVHDPLGGFPNVGMRVANMTGVKAVAAAGSIVVCTECQISELSEWLKKVSPKMENGSLLVIDEGVLLTTVDHHEKLAREIRALAATARHRHLRLAIIAQGSMLIDHHLVSAADTVALFGLVGRFERDKMVACAIPDKVAEAAVDLPDHEYYRGVPGRKWHEWHRHVTQAMVMTP
jgi:hypothetical protein